MYLLNLKIFTFESMGSANWQSICHYSFLNLIYTTGPWNKSRLYLPFLPTALSFFGKEKARTFSWISLPLWYTLPSQTRNIQIFCEILDVSFGPSSGASEDDIGSAAACMKQIQKEAGNYNEMFQYIFPFVSLLNLNLPIIFKQVNNLSRVTVQNISDFTTIFS